MNSYGNRPQILFTLVSPFPTNSRKVSTRQCKTYLQNIKTFIRPFMQTFRLEKRVGKSFFIIYYNEQSRRSVYSRIPNDLMLSRWLNKKNIWVVLESLWTIIGIAMGMNCALLVAVFMRAIS